MMNKKTRFIIILIAGCILIASVVFLLTFRVNKPQKTEVEIPEVEDSKLFGISLTDWNVMNDTVRDGEYLGTIFNRFGISTVMVDKISKMKDSVDYTKISVDRPYTVFMKKNDTSKTAQIFIYQNTPLQYTVFDFRKADTVLINMRYHEVDTVEKTAYGKIETSLWDALSKKGYNWELAIEMSQVWAWTVDFYALQTDNWFKVVYEEYHVDGEVVKFGKVKAGVFYHGGKELWSIPFEQDSVKTFFDTSGLSMRKTFLKSPLKYTRVSSRYSTSRMHPIHHRPKAHLAVDFAAPAGTPIYAASDGKIVTRKYGNGSGNYVAIRHNGVYQTVYMHLSRFGKYNVGDYVSQGEVIGYVGSTGWSTGPHLHYEVHENGRKINPLSFNPPPAEPVKKENMERFNIEKRPWIDKINKIKAE